MLMPMVNTAGISVKTGAALGARDFSRSSADFCPFSSLHV